MTNKADAIYQKLQAMPSHLQGEVLDFIEFIEQKNGLDSPIKNNEKTQKLQQIMQQLAQNNSFNQIADPISWQKCEREDRELPR